MSIELADAELVMLSAAARRDDRRLPRRSRHVCGRPSCGKTPEISASLREAGFRRAASGKRRPRTVALDSWSGIAAVIVLVRGYGR
jgi:hypothetical protein